MQWIFVAADGQQYSFSEADLASLIQTGQITGQTLLWREGMAQWTPAASLFPSAFGPSPSATQPMGAPSGGAPGPRSPAPAPRQPGAPASPQATSSLRQPAATTGALRGAGGPSGSAVPMPDPGAIRRLATPLFARKGWIKFLAVLIILVGVVSIPIGILLILAGAALFKAVGEIEHAHRSGDPHSLEEAQKRLSSALLLQAIFTLVFLAIVATYVALFSAVVMAGLNQARDDWHKSRGGDSGSSSGDSGLYEIPSGLKK